MSLYWLPRKRPHNWTREKRRPAFVTDTNAEATVRAEQDRATLQRNLDPNRLLTTVDDSYD